MKRKCIFNMLPALDRNYFFMNIYLYPSNGIRVKIRCYFAKLFVDNGPHCAQNSVSWTWSKRFNILLIGQLSEKTQEAKNKDFKIFHRGFSRKRSRIKTNGDILNILLLSLNSYVSPNQKMPKKKLKIFSLKVIGFLLGKKNLCIIKTNLTVKK